mmetsp:Transcript_129770/g.361543  ORF Transcript_129770/g.361543 Transcript_129770/m.361543 type:complete len:238 (+) Transcript_129770:177-890(+)
MVLRRFLGDAMGPSPCAFHSASDWKGKCQACGVARPDTEGVSPLPHGPSLPASMMPGRPPSATATRSAALGWRADVEQGLGGLDVVEEPPQADGHERQHQQDAGKARREPPAARLQLAREDGQGDGKPGCEPAHVRRPVHHRQEAQRDQQHHRGHDDGKLRVPHLCVSWQCLVPGCQDEGCPGANQTTQGTRRSNTQGIRRDDATRKTGIEARSYIDEEPRGMPPQHLKHETGTQLK